MVGVHSWSSFAVLALASSTAFALPKRSNHVLHERNTGTSTNWRRGTRVAHDAIIPLRIGLTQSNLESGYERLMAVSHPESPQYGQHLSADEVHDIFRPADSAVEEVRAWLQDAGVTDHIVHSDNKGWLAVDLPAQQVEELFQTHFYEHEHADSGNLRIGCDEYHVPAHLQKHIDYITPGVKLSATLKKRSLKRDAAPAPRRRGPQMRPISEASAALASTPLALSEAVTAGTLDANLADCALNITPACIRALYSIPFPHLNDTVNSLGLYEDGDHYSPADVNAFFAHWAPYVPQGTLPLPAYIDGAEGPVPVNSPLNGGESDIDIDMTTSLIYPQTVTLYQTDDAPQAALQLNSTLEGFLNTFLDALDGSYCNYSAYGITGDSPGIDAEYPDPLPGGYKGPLQCGVYKPTRVISGSYGEAENDLPIRYQLRQCNEFLKLGLQGHTILFSSSDYGVAAPPGDGSPSGCLSGYGQNQTIYAPDYPANCPYVLGVGGTQLNPGESVHDPESSMQVNLGPGGLALFASHGGFANYFSTPLYQQPAVTEYFALHDPGHPFYIANAEGTNVGINGGIYNRIGRGIPDVSANGAYFQAYNQGNPVHFFGTSLAAPLWASVITLINEHRLLIGKSSVGFIHPALYANPWLLNDITNGSNPNCGSSGFKAVPGWDPVTGLGSPNFPRLLEFFTALP